jgi:hypothetical protein
MGRNTERPATSAVKQIKKPPKIRDNQKFLSIRMGVLKNNDANLLRVLV